MVWGDRKMTEKTDQYALLATVITRQGGEAGRLGKKALQKYVHLIQEFGGVDSEYQFSFYTYGPYSSALAGDLDILNALDGADIVYDAADNHYQISPSDNTNALIRGGQAFLDQYRAGIDKVLSAFGGRKAKDLELISTIAYLWRHAPKEEFADDRKLMVHVRALKPKFSEGEISRAIQEVRSFLSPKQ